MQVRHESKLRRRDSSNEKINGKIELGVAGKDGYFDDIKVWNAEPVKQ